jgi:hypothetical protein
MRDGSSRSIASASSKRPVLIAVSRSSLAPAAESAEATAGPVLIAAHARGQQGRVFGDHVAQLVRPIERNGRPYIERRTLVEQIGRDIVADLIEACRPSQHAHGVVVAMALDIGAGFDQQPDRVEIGMRGGEVQRRGIVGKIALVEISAALDQQADRTMPATQ